MADKKVLVIAGPTGCGESTITNEIVRRFPVFTRLITATTRKKRNKEKNLVDYYFFTKEKFQKEISNGNIIEYAYVKNRDTYYGSYKPELEDKIKKGFNIIINPDIVGTKFYKKNYNATAIFIKPDSLENLEKRIVGREPNISSDELQKRLNNAKNEIAREMPFYDFVVENKQDKLEEAVSEVVDILKKEKYRLL